MAVAGLGAGEADVAGAEGEADGDTELVVADGLVESAGAACCPGREPAPPQPASKIETRRTPARRTPRR